VAAQGDVTVEQLVPTDFDGAVAGLAALVIDAVDDTTFFWKDLRGPAERRAG
jgi:hypothetical protein